MTIASPNGCRKRARNLTRRLVSKISERDEVQKKSKIICGCSLRHWISGMKVRIREMTTFWDRESEVFEDILEKNRILIPTRRKVENYGSTDAICAVSK